jgi:transcriptional regulator with XRE-family HTH domain
MPGINETVSQLRTISPKELALLVTLQRQGMGWTQETLAEISGLTVRTVQRVEKGEASSVDTRRALARAFQIEDIDAFNKPHAFKSAEQLKQEAEEFQNKHMSLPVSVAAFGKQLADLAENAEMHCFQQPENVSQSVAELVAEIYDYISDYGEIAELYSHGQKLAVHTTLDEQLSRLKAAGYSICYALRKTSIVGRNWVDKAPMPVSIAYAFVTKKGNEPKLALVTKSLDLVF